MMTNNDNPQLNRNTTFPYSSSFDPESSPAKNQLKITVFEPFLYISYSAVLRNMDHSLMDFFEKPVVTNRLSWIRCTSQVAADIFVH